MSEKYFYELQYKIINIYMEGLISNDDLEDLTSLNRFINIKSNKKYNVDSNKVIKPKRFPTVENSKFWKFAQDYEEEKRMTALEEKRIAAVA